MTTTIADICTGTPTTSAVLAWLGPEALALAWLLGALALRNHKPGQLWQLRLGNGLAWPRPQPVTVR